MLGTSFFRGNCTYATNLHYWKLFRGILAREKMSTSIQKEYIQTLRALLGNIAVPTQYPLSTHSIPTQYPPNTHW